jgi:microcystin degradation protein MlrC
MRIAVAHFMHETVTFLRNPTTRDDFIYTGSPLTGEALLGSCRRSYIGGFVKAAREYEEVELIGVTSPMFPKTGTASGWITQDAFEWFTGIMLHELAAEGRLDGVYLALHGAMAVQGVARPEAELASRIRALLGPRVVIGATFDPHGNEDEAFFQVADLAFCAKYYPHYDEYLQGTRAARTLVRTIRRDYRPAHVTCKVPLLTPTVMQCTDVSPWSDLVQRALVWEARSPDLYVNVFFGFPWGDVVDAGMTIQATTNADEQLAAQAVQDLAEFAWRVRSRLAKSTPIEDIREGVGRAKSLASEADGGRIIIADHSDRSGRASRILQEVLAQQLSNTLLATIADRTAVERVLNAGASVGDAFDMQVGGGNEASDGSPVRVAGRIRDIARVDHLPEFAGNSPWIEVEFGDGNVLVLSPFQAQIMEPSTLVDALSLDLEKLRIIVLKSRVHFRRGFVDTGLASHVLIVEPEQPFLGTSRLDALPYANLRIADYYPYGRDTFEPRLLV